MHNYLNIKCFVESVFFVIS